MRATVARPQKTAKTTVKVFWTGVMLKKSGVWPGGGGMRPTISVEFEGGAAEAILEVPAKAVVSMRSGNALLSSFFRRSKGSVDGFGGMEREKSRDRGEAREWGGWLRFL